MGKAVYSVGIDYIDRTYRYRKSILKIVWLQLIKSIYSFHFINSTHWLPLMLVMYSLSYPYFGPTFGRIVSESTEPPAQRFVFVVLPENQHWAFRFSENVAK